MAGRATGSVVFVTACARHGSMMPGVGRVGELEAGGLGGWGGGVADEFA